MPAEIREGEGPDRDGQRFERGGRAALRRLTCQHARDVGFERERDDVVGIAVGEADADHRGRVERLRLTDDRKKRDGHRDQLHDISYRSRWHPLRHRHMIMPSPSVW